MNGDGRPAQSGAPAEGRPGAGDSRPNRLDLSDVCEAEKAALLSRREAANLPADGGKGAVGLALSGGGVRSASFNLGLIQALHRYGLLRYVDYLSTVSGGTYVGSTLTAEGRRLADKGENILNREAFSIRQDEDGRPTAYVRNILRGGSYLDWVLHALNSYLFGLILVNLLIGSAILFAAAAVAVAWRTLDAPPVCELILLGTGGMLMDAVRPFAPALVFLLAWLFGAAIARRRAAGTAQPWIGALFFVAGLLVPLLATVLLGVRTYTPNDTFQWARERSAIRLALPLPFLLTFAWPIAWVVTSPRPDFGRAIARLGAAGASAVLALYVVTVALPRGPALWGVGCITAVGAAVAAWTWNRNYLPAAGGRPEGRATADDVTVRLRWLLVLAGAAALVGAAVWLATPEPNLTAVGKAGEQQVSKLGEWILVPLFGVLVASLLPLLSPRRLLESGLRPKRFWEPLVFQMTTYAALVGVPLLAVWYFARHNYSEIVPERPAGGPAALKPDDIRWDPLLKRVKADKDDRGRPHRLLLAELGTEQLPSAPVTLFPEDRARWEGPTDRLNGLIKGGRITGFYKDLGQNPVTADRDREDVRRQARATHPSAEYIVGQLDRLDRGAAGEDEPELDRLLLEVFYPDGVKRMTEVRRTRVILTDQAWRLVPLLGFLALFLAAAWLVDLNKTSMHRFYRDRLARVYISPDGAGRPGDHPLLQDFERSVEAGVPYHLLTATRNLLGVRRALSTAPDPGARSADAPRVATFVLSPMFCGPAADGTYLRTEAYAARVPGAGLTLADATALSGAAVSPSQMDNTLKLFLMMVLNLRLGQWLPGLAYEKATQPTTPWKILRALVARPGDLEYYFLSDGGHHENLGIEPLLDRQCRVIIVSDATRDPTYEFRDFLRLYRRARMEKGVIICDPRRSRSDLDERELDRVRPRAHRADAGNAPGRKDNGSTGPTDRKTASLQSAAHAFVAGIRYPDDKSAEDPQPKSYLVYLKASITGDEPVDLLGHWAGHREFPHDTTANQFFDPDQVESYRALGFHIGKDLCVRLLEERLAEGEEPPADFWEDNGHKPASEELRRLIESTLMTAQAPRPGPISVGAALPQKG